MSLLKRLTNRLRPTVETPKGVPTLRTRPRGTPQARVIFAALGPGRFHGYGKMEPRSFMPGFCAELHASGIATEFVTDAATLAQRVGPDSITIHIYKEEMDQPEPIQDSPVVFNSPELGRFVRQKDATNRLLSSAGIPVPRMILSDAEAQDVKVFSNVLDSTGADTALNYRADHYNTEFIDTRVSYRGLMYYTTVRLQCVGRELVHCNVRARPATDSSASVHARDIPLDPELIEYLYQTMVLDRLDQHRALARQIAGVLEPGFFAHDLVIDRETGVAHVAEVGLKFDERSYRAHLAPILHKLPSHKSYETEYPRDAARAFLAVCRDLEVLKAA